MTNPPISDRAKPANQRTDTLRWLWLGCLWALMAAWGSGCTTADKRLTYQYQPTYGVESAEFLRSMEALRSRITPGNQVRLLQDGDGFFTDILKEIQQAQKTINIEMYIFANGDVGRAFASALSERARAGVEVRVLVDAVGARMGELEGLMLQAGVRVEIYRPLRIFSLHKAGERTHRKIVVVDGRIGYCGGLGIDDRWKGQSRNENEWRDLVVRVEGPVVSQLQSIFMEDWLHTTGDVLHGNGQFPTQENAGNQLAQAVSSSRTDQSSMAKLMVYMAIQAARKSIWIENAYFVPDRQIRKSLVDAAKRGVDVRVIVPGKHIDIPTLRRASRYHYNELLDGGVKIYEFQPAMLHTKAMVVDDIWATVGSVNFVRRSMIHNTEANVIVYDRQFAEELSRIIELDLARSDALTKEEWRKRGFGDRFSELFSWMFSETIY
jgi:cardiolipin synthase